jgi:pantoate--beta-alanine ligase
MVVRRMVRDLDMPVQIVGLATARDGHGLALSSRNAYLSEAELQTARRLNGVLAEAGARAAQGGPVADAEAWAEAALKAAGFDTIDYVAIRRADDLSPFDGALDGPARILAAAKIGRTRLIDNMAV